MPTEMKQDTGVLLNNFQQFCTDYVYRVSVCARTKCRVPDDLRTKGLCALFLKKYPNTQHIHVQAFLNTLFEMNQLVPVHPFNDTVLELIQEESDQRFCFNEKRLMFAQRYSIYVGTPHITQRLMDFVKLNDMKKVAA